MQTDQSRFIPNTLLQFNPQFNFIPLYEQLFKLLINSVNTFNQYVDPKIPMSIASKQSKNKLNYEIFDGIWFQFICILGAGGNLMVYLRLYEFSLKLTNDEIFKKQIQLFAQKSLSPIFFNEFFQPQKYLQMAQNSFLAFKNMIQQENPKNQGISFYCGTAGIWLLGCHLHYHLNNKKDFNECLKALLDIKKLICKYPNDQYYEILYGVSGYLYCLLDLQSNFEFGPHKTTDFNVNLSEDVLEITELIINKGLEKFCIPLTSNFEDDKIYPKGFRLFYTFHDKEYFGGAHGLFGILQMIMIAYKLNKSKLSTKAELQKKLFFTCKKSLEFIKQFQLPSGNYPSSERGKNEDRLMQFCHGATGAIAPLLLASQIYQEQIIQSDYLLSAERACLAIWQQGILKKGFGICHGISGNAYSFLSFYKNSLQPQWLFDAIQFALVKDNKEIMKQILDYNFSGRYIIGVADHPFSLMQGLAGDILLILDIFDIDHAKFPGYEVGPF